STPTGRAPRRASQAETYAVPQPSSTTSSPPTSPSVPSDASGTEKTPHVISSPPMLRSHGRPCAPRSPASSSRGCAGRRRTARPRPSRLEQAVGEEQPELPPRARARVGAVHDVLREEGRQVAADRPGRRVGRVRRAHQPADPGDRILAADGERQHGTGGDEVDEVTEER